MKRYALPILIVVGIAAAAWKITWGLAEDVVGGEELVAPEASAKEVRLADIVDQLVESELSDATIDGDVRKDTDDWSVRTVDARLPNGFDVGDRAALIEELVEDDRYGDSPSIEAYVTTANELDVDVRVYIGKRLSHHLRLKPTLTSAPVADPLSASTGAPLVALVISDIGPDAEGVLVLQAGIPLTVGIVPFSPFALRAARNAVLSHKEVLIDLQPGQPLDLAVDAVPYATGLLVTEPPGMALDDALLASEDLYLLDAAGELEPSTLREARNAGIPVLRASEVVTADQDWAARAEHLAELHGAVVLMVPLSEAPGAIRWLHARQGDLRPAFANEVLERGG
ncbi:MAG: hypothetical protein GY913_33875 [Proteobacteria bacterium]|nr:hypothetical protein [Pseudomonadota bacterium]MCP4921917.1 hypothetical protein [Pseudomonadota bacterium]